jgi:hypothetical protein
MVVLHLWYAEYIVVQYKVPDKIPHMALQAELEIYKLSIQQWLNNIVFKKYKYFQI